MQFPPDTHQIWSFYGETVLMIIIDSNANAEVNAYNPPSIGIFIQDVQRAMGLPQRNSVKLNRALPTKQGIGKDTRPRQCEHCKGTPETPRLAMRIRSQIDIRRPWWFSACADQPFEKFLCRLCYHFQVEKSGQLPSTVEIQRWDQVNVVYFKGAPSNIDRSQCASCKTPALER